MCYTPLRSTTEQRKRLGPFKHVSSIVTPHNGNASPTPPPIGLTNIPTGGVSVSTTIAPPIIGLENNGNAVGIVGPVTTSNGAPSNNAQQPQSDEILEIPQQGFGFQRPLPYFPFQFRQQNQPQHYQQQQLAPHPVFFNGLPPQFQSPFSTHQSPFGFPHQFAHQVHIPQNQFYGQQQFGGNQLNSPYPGVNQYNPQQYPSQGNGINNNILSDDNSPSSIASQITNQISNQIPSTQPPNNWFEQLGQFGQNVGQSFTDFGQNIGNGFNSAWQQVNQFGQNVGQTFGNIFQPNREVSRYYGVLPLGYHNVQGVKRDLGVHSGNIGEGGSVVSKEAEWFKKFVNDKRTETGASTADHAAPISYHH